MVGHPSKKRRTDETGAQSSNPSQPLKSILKTTKKPDPPASETEDDQVTYPPSPESGHGGDNDEFSDSEAAQGDDDDAYDDVSGSGSGTGSGSGSDADSLDSVLATQSSVPKKRKRNDPTIFSTSMSKILSSHLTTKSRADPVLVRSKRTHTVDESKLESKARRALATQKRLELEKGRVRNVIPQSEDAEMVKKALDRERALRKIAQRGVVKLFNAVRAAQVKTEDAQREVRQKGLVGLGNREQKGLWH